MMNHEKNRKAYDKKAANYDHTPDGRFTEKFKSLLLENIDLRDNDSVLDVGCGNGTLLSKLAKRKSIHGFGIDISPRMIQNAKVRYPEFVFTVSGCERIPFEKDSMDIITVSAAYHHFSDVDAFALEARRVLKPGGMLYIAEIYLPAVIRQVANCFLPLSKDGDVRFYSPAEIIRTFSSADFHLMDTVKRRHIQIVRLQRGQYET